MGLRFFINDKIRSFRLKKYKSKLKNTDFSIISMNCNGSFISHDLGVRFNSPTVNLYLEFNDFMKYLKDLDYYNNLQLAEVKDNKSNFPVGKLDDIYIYFQHYNTFQEAKVKWDERKKRINKENLFIIATDRDGCTVDGILEFDNLPYKNKVIFTNKKYDNIKSAYYIEGFQKDNSVGIMSDYIGISGKRYLDQFDYVSWLNSNVPN